MPKAVKHSNLGGPEYTADAAIRTRIKDKKRKLVRNLLTWSENNAPDYPWRKTSDPYRVMASEMLLRRTRASAVIDVYRRFLRKFPTLNSLANASTGDIESIIEPLGIKSRSRWMQTAARNLNSAGRNSFPLTEKELYDAFGKGSRYTVSAIRCFALNQKVPIFDVNVERIFARVFSIEFGADPHRKKRSWEIVSHALPDRNIKQYNWALLDLGKTVCTKSKPGCKICPLNSICDYAGGTSC